MVPEKYITLQELSSQTGIPYTTLRKWVKRLGIEPDTIDVLPNGVYKYSYGVSSIRALYDHMIQRRNAITEKYRSCYHCKGHFNPDDLQGGLCPLCQAKKVVINYGCKGDPVCNSLDENRLDILIEAIKIIKDSYIDPHERYD